jgi:hypothetical protein
MLITKDYLESLNPCKNRFDHYLIHYSNWQGTLEEFLNLKELTHADKTWVFARSTLKDNLRLLAADFAERVLHVYESKYPNDNRPRKAIEAARGGDKEAAKHFAAACDATAYEATQVAYSAARAADIIGNPNVDAILSAVRATILAVNAYTNEDAQKAEEQAQIEIMKRYAREQQ